MLLQGYGTGTWAVLTAALVGRPIGTLLATFAMIAAGLRLPLQLRTRELVVAALATSSGFTTAVFMAIAAYPPGPARAEVTLGALFTVVGAAVTIGAAWMLRTGGLPSGLTPVGDVVVIGWVRARHTREWLRAGDRAPSLHDVPHSVRRPRAWPFLTSLDS